METIKKKQVMLEIRVGLFFMLIIVLLMGVLFLVKSKTDLLEPHFSFRIVFPQIQGLKLGAPVQLAGVRIGEVTDVEFPEEANDTSVIVTVRVKKSVQNRIKEDSLVYIDSPSLLSEKNVQITFGLEESPSIHSETILRGLSEKP